VYTVVKEIFLTSDLQVGSDTLRLLREGETLDVLEWDKKEESSGVMRMKVKARSDDGAVGWVTKASTDDVAFLKLCAPP